MIRKRLGVITAAIILVPIFVLLLLNNPDLSEERTLVDKMSVLRDRLAHAEMTNRDRLGDVRLLSKKFHLLVHSDNSSLRVPLSSEAKGLLANGSSSLNTDLHLPSIFSFMPHLLTEYNSTAPAFKLSKGRTAVDVILGVPTVRREVQSYLMTTLRNLVDALPEKDRARCLIVVFVGECDLDYVNMVASQVERKLGEHVESGLIDVISPPSSFYPNLETLKVTLGDPIQRVRWRTKQNLDYAFLMMYSQPKGVYYVQLEDDIQAKKGFLNTMTTFALQKSSEKKNWIVLDFCQLGFIGKMFKCAELPFLIQFFVMFYNDKPVDWLLDYLIQTKVCNLDKDVKACKKAKDLVWIHYRPSVFQHIGTHSSLKGKVQKLKDKQFGKVQLHFPHLNPPAKVDTTIKSYKTFTIDKAYRGDSYFWGLLPQVGDVFHFNFTPSTLVEGFLFRSGNVEHPSDKLFNTTVEVFPLEPPQTTPPYRKTNDNFYIVGSFDDMGLAEGKMEFAFGDIQTLRLSVHSESENWAILSEILIKVPAR